MKTTIFVLTSVFALSAGGHSRTVRSSYNNLAFYSEEELPEFHQNAWSNFTTLTSGNAVSVLQGAASASWQDINKQISDTMGKLGLVVSNFGFKKADICFDEHVTLGQAVASQLENSKLAELLASSSNINVLDNWYNHANCLSDDLCPENVELTITEFSGNDDETLVFRTTIFEMQVEGLDTAAKMYSKTTNYAIVIKRISSYQVQTILSAQLVAEIDGRIQASESATRFAGPNNIEEIYTSTIVPIGAVCSTKSNQSGGDTNESDANDSMSNSVVFSSTSAYVGAFSLALLVFF